MVDDNYKNTSDNLWQNTSDDKWASIILDVFNLYHQNISTKLSIIVNKGLVLKYSLLDLYSNNLDLSGVIEQYISPNNSLFYNYLPILDLITTDVENRFVDTEDDHWISTEDDKWYGNIFLSVDNTILKNYISIITLQIGELNLNIINSIHNNLLSISNLIRNRYLESNRSLHNQYTQDLGLLPRGLLLDNDNIVHDHYTRNFLELAFGFGLEVIRSLHDNYLSSNSNLLRERYLSVFNSLLNFYSSIFDLVYYKLLNILNTVHNNNSVIDLNLKLEKLLLTDKTLHEQFANNISVFLAGIADLSVKSIYHKNSPIENYSQLIPVSGQNPIDTDIYWNKSKCTIDSDGGIIANAESGSHSIYKQITSIVGTTYILQAKIKPGNKNWAMIEVDTGNYTYFDLQNGVVGSTINGGIAGIESVGDGYYLCWVERIAEDVLYRSSFYPADSNNDWDFTGDGSTVNIYIKEISFKKFDFGVDLILNKIFEIISGVLENNSYIIENIISKGIVVKDSYHDNYESIVNIILRDLVISSISCVNDLINDVVENEIDISIVVDNILNEIFGSNSNLDVQPAVSIGLIIFDSIISMYSGKSVLTITEIATLYNFIAKNIKYVFVAKESEDY